MCLDTQAGWMDGKVKAAFGHFGIPGNTKSDRFISCVFCSDAFVSRLLEAWGSLSDQAPHSVTSAMQDICPSCSRSAASRVHQHLMVWSLFDLLPHHSHSIEPVAKVSQSRHDIAATR
jgi:hypothetical protein